MSDCCERTEPCGSECARAWERAYESKAAAYEALQRQVGDVREELEFISRVTTCGAMSRDNFNLICSSAEKALAFLIGGQDEEM